jgi:hypothetical protein
MIQIRLINGLRYITRLRVKISPQLPLFFPFLICSTPFCLFVCLIIIEYSCTLIVFRGEITCMYRRVPKGEKTNWPLFRTVWLPYFCSCHFSRFWVGEVFLWKEDVYMCAYTRVLISRACSNNIFCDTAFFELVCLLHQSYLRCLDSLMILLQSAISERLGS